jgi:CRP-like cAMP-binding protein
MIMIDELVERLKADTTRWAECRNMFREMEIPAKTVLLCEGEIATRFFFIKQGCLRMWYNKDGKDITLQFFFEGQGVASIESLMSNEPSMFTLESIEPCLLIVLEKGDFEKLQQYYPAVKDSFYELIMQRFRHYAGLFLSRIKDSPKERYDDLVRNHPEILQRIPQHYIASYLGITPVSLSRIRNRK